MLSSLPIRRKRENFVIIVAELQKLSLTRRPIDVPKLTENLPIFQHMWRAPKKPKQTHSCGQIWYKWCHSAKLLSYLRIRKKRSIWSSLWQSFKKHRWLEDPLMYLNWQKTYQSSNTWVASKKKENSLSHTPIVDIDSPIQCQTKPDNISKDA